MEELKRITYREHMEGSADDVELAYLAGLAKGCKWVAEIGFNAGYSAYNFLEHSDAKVVSFDLCEHGYVWTAKKYIDKVFPERHALIMGDSKKTVPIPGKAYDLIFIDGGHDYDTAMADLMNMRQHAHRGTILVMDDLSPKEDYGIGPYRAWQEAKENGIIEEVEIVHHGPRNWGRAIYKEILS